MITAINLPKSFISKRECNLKIFHGGHEDFEDLIIRPEIEFDLPEFIVKADEILEAELERIRILNNTPVAVLCQP